MKGRFLDAVIAAGREARSVALATELGGGRQLLFDEIRRVLLLLPHRRRRPNFNR